MTLLIQKQPTNGYSTIANRDADTDTTATVPRVITRRSTWTTVRSWSGVIVIVAGMTMLVAGGAVWLRDSGSSYTTATEGLVVGTQGNFPCVPATGTFGGFSTTSSIEDYPFETCYQFDQLETYCWTQSYYSKPSDESAFSKKKNGSYFRCVPDGGGNAWHAISIRVTHGLSCGRPCQGQHPLDTCFTAGGYGQDAYFKGKSDNTWAGKYKPFQTCYQYADMTKYCWSNSYPRSTKHDITPTTIWYECHPKPKHGQWHDIDPKYVNTPGVDPNTNPKRCGPPCDEMYPDD